MDRISNLPDELLVKILTSVPTKVAVSTSVLSKRWEFLWMWLPKLEFVHRDCSESKCQRLQSFLDKNLPLHRAPVIESFRLESCSWHYKPESISTWVSTVVSPCLRELDILHEVIDSNILPCDLFTCKSLVILKLVGEILLDVPPVVSLPSLRTLKLEKVRNFSEESLQRLLSNCPILEDLVVELHDGTDPAANSNILPSDLFTRKSLVFLKLDGEILLDVPPVVSLPSLKTLKLQRVRNFSEETIQRLLSNCPILEDLVVELHDDDESTGKLTVIVPSLQRLSLYIPYSTLIDGYVVETPALKYFKLVEHSRSDHYSQIAMMPCLVEAHLDCFCPDIGSVFGPIASVKHLAVCAEAITFDEVFVFNQLEHLEVCLCTLYNVHQLVVALLKASSNLKRLDFSFMDQHKPIGMVWWDQPTTVPECILSSLQSLSWSDYTGDLYERAAVVYFLKHAAHLKTATIKSSESTVRKLEMLNELELSPRASATCQLMFD